MSHTERKQDYQPAIGLLGLYIALYDEVRPESRGPVEEFYGTIADALESRGLRVVRAPICTRRPHVEDALGGFANQAADAVVTLHLAYSPSLESVDPLAESSFPIVVLDTTPTAAFGPDQDPAHVMFNHGIHGVQDLCTMLIRRGRTFMLHAGHWQKSDVLDRVVRSVRAASIAGGVQNAPIGLVGSPFRGMGDFQLPFKELQRDLGLRVVPYQAPEPPAPDAVAAAVSRYRSAFPDSDCPGAVLERSVRVELAVRAWAQREKLRGMSFNFGDVTEENGFETVPFLAAGALMAEGIGYAGEGDVLTAALVGALARAYPDTTFSEMFCPDWDGGRIYMAHMGEANHRVLTGPPQILEMDYKFSATNNPAYASGRLRPGPACIVNAVPLGEGEYRLIVAEGEMCDVTGEDRFTANVHGWFRPSLGVPDFLEAYSNVGGTHHLAVAYNARVDELEAFAVFMGWDVVEIR